MIDIELLWDLIQKNSIHIGVINGELARVLAILEIHTALIKGQFYVMASILIATVCHLIITKNNNKKK